MADPFPEMNKKTENQTTHLLLESIHEAYPDLLVESVRAHGGEGQFNHILILNETLVFRFPRYKQSLDPTRREIELLKQIHGLVPLPIPNPVFTRLDPPVVTKVFMGYPFLPGKPLWRKMLDGIEEQEVQVRLAAQLAGFLQALHQITIDRAASDLPVSETRQEWEVMYRAVQDELFGLMRPDAVDQVKAHFERFLDDPSLQEYSPTLRHGDFGPSNILYHAETRSISGILDFSSAGPGDPATDIAAISCYGEPFFSYILRAYPQNEALLKRAAFYQGTFALQEALHGLRSGDRAAFESGMAPYRMGSENRL